MVRRTPRAAKQPSTLEAVRAQSVLLEQLGSRMDVVLEAVNGSAQRLDTKIDAVEVRLSGRISVLEEVVRESSRDIRKHSQDIRDLREEVAGLRHDFDHREELGRVGALEARVSAIESRLAAPSR
jgi:hypothetical protein